MALYKPKGYVTTRSDPEGRPTVMDLIGEGGYIYPVGRLDYDSEGLLLMTTDGDLAARLTHPRHEVEKVYEVIVLGMPDPAAIEKLRKGVFIDGRRTSPADVHVGINRQGRPADDEADHNDPRGPKPPDPEDVQCRGIAGARSRRMRMGPIGLGRLKPGQWRDLTPEEVRRLKTLRLPSGRALRLRSGQGDVQRPSREKNPL